MAARVLVCGSRDWTDEDTIRSRLIGMHSDTVVIQGGASGADQMARDIARERGLHVAEVLPQWDRFGQRAGYLRNCAMLDLEPDRVIAFTTGSKGTQLTIDEARRRGIRVEVYRPEEPAS